MREQTCTACNGQLKDEVRDIEQKAQTKWEEKKATTAGQKQNAVGRDGRTHGKKNMHLNKNK